MPATAADEHFLSLGMQYYAAARAAALAQLLPACGNLYHHAIEAMIKARLSQKQSLKDLKKTGHDLLGLWNAFKAEFPSAGLDQFDGTIAAVERFEKLRYPDEIIAKGALIIVEWESSPAPSGQISGTTPPPPRYEIVVTDIDRLIARIFEVCSRNPAFFTGAMTDYAREAITRDNPVAEQLVKPKA